MFNTLNYNNDQKIINYNRKGSQSGLLYSAILICNQGKVVPHLVHSSSGNSTLASLPLDFLFLQLTNLFCQKVAGLSLATFSPPIFLHIQILLLVEPDHHQQYCKLPWKLDVENRNYRTKAIFQINSLLSQIVCSS